MAPTWASIMIKKISSLALTTPYELALNQFDTLGLIVTIGLRHPFLSTFSTVDFEALKIRIHTKWKSTKDDYWCISLIHALTFSCPPSSGQTISHV